MKLGGFPVRINHYLPRDEVWLRTDDDLVRLVNLANGEAAKEQLLRRVATLERRLARVLSSAYHPRRRRDVDGDWHDCGYHRRGAWSGKRAERARREAAQTKEARCQIESTS